MSNYRSLTTELANGDTVTMVNNDKDGREITAVWITNGMVHWEDNGAGTVHVGTPLEFHEWMVLHS